MIFIRCVLLLGLYFLSSITNNVNAVDENFSSISQNTNPIFTNLECLDSNFELEKKIRWNRFFFWKSSFQIVKKACHITIKVQKWPYFTDTITIDVCREPVHFRWGTDADVVVSRGESDFLKEYFLLEDILTNKILVNAEGEKEDLSKEHGKDYCSFLLVYNYLAKGIVFSRFINNILPESMVELRAKELKANSVHIKKINEAEEALKRLNDEKVQILEREEALKNKLKELEDKNKTETEVK